MHTTPLFSIIRKIELQLNLTNHLNFTLLGLIKPVTIEATEVQGGSTIFRFKSNCLCWALK